jgi:hypothetical protein
VEQEVRDEIKVMAANAERPIDVGLRIRNHPHMTVTAANKMRRAQDCAFTYSGTKIQARHIITQNKEVVDKNYSVTKDLFTRCTRHGRQEPSRLHDFRNAHLFRSVPAEVVLQFLDGYLFSPDNGKFTNELITDYITKQLRVGELKDWSVAFLSSQQGTDVDLGGKSAKAFDRSVLKRLYLEPSADSVQLRALSAPGDEIIDLGDCLEDGVAKIADLLPEDKECESEISLRRRYRPAERPLLLVYPLNWKQVAAEGKKFDHSEPLTARGPVFGITFVFPFSKRDQSRFGFVANKTITGPRPFLREVKAAPSALQPVPSVPASHPAATPKEWRLSKSQYVKGRKCLKRVWLYNHQRQLADDPSEMQLLLFRQGNEVGQLAQQYFGGGHLIDEDYTNPEGAVEHTKRAMADPGIKVLFEAAFIFDGVLVRVDALKKNPDGALDLIEVKSTNSVKKEHKDDVAVQKYVLENSGHKIRASYLMHLNGDYVLDDTLIATDLFVLEPMDEEIEEQLAAVPNYLKLIRAKLSEGTEPDSQIGSQCKSPYPCESNS